MAVERRRNSAPPLAMSDEQLHDDRQVCGSSSKTRSWQFSLRSLFVVTTVVAVLLKLALTTSPILLFRGEIWHSL